jgi:hypothetical protein
MRAASMTWRSSTEGQQWLNTGQIFNEQAHEETCQAEVQTTALQTTPQHRAPVMQL